MILPFLPLPLFFPHAGRFLPIRSGCTYTSVVEVGGEIKVSISLPTSAPISHAGRSPPTSFARSDAWISGGWRRRGGRKNLHAEMGGIEKGRDLSPTFSLAFLAVRRINGGPHIPGMGMKSVDYRITAFGLAANPDHVPRHECCTTAAQEKHLYCYIHASLCVYYARQGKEKNSFGKKCSSPPHPPPHPYPNM